MFFTATVEPKFLVGAGGHVRVRKLRFLYEQNHLIGGMTTLSPTAAVGMFAEAFGFVVVGSFGKSNQHFFCFNTPLFKQKTKKQAFERKIASSTAFKRRFFLFLG